MFDRAAHIAIQVYALKDEKRFVFTAALHARRATDFPHGHLPELTEERVA